MVWQDDAAWPVVDGLCGLCGLEQAEASVLVTSERMLMKNTICAAKFLAC